MDSKEKVIRLRSPATVYRPLIRIGSVHVLDAPSRFHHNLLFLRHEIPGSFILSDPINHLSNIISRHYHR